MNVPAALLERPTTRPSPAAARAKAFPDSDGQPMADNTRQLHWIVLLYGNLCLLLRDLVDVCVFADLLWYPDEERPGLRLAPDVMVVFGRPRGHRGSYKQWLEGDVTPTVVFEIESPGNTSGEMESKLRRYDDLGVEEYYVYNPQTKVLKAWRRVRTALLKARPLHGFVSPRLGIRIDISGEEPVVFRPDGLPFLPFEELGRLWELEKKRAESEKNRANAEKNRANAEKNRADRAETKLAEEKQRSARLAQLSRKARRGQANAEELEELERLEQAIEPPPA